MREAETGDRRPDNIIEARRSNIAPRVSTVLRFAVIALSKTVDVGRDHLIHRKRSPFPYEGKALTPPKVGETCNVEQRGNASLAAILEDLLQPCYPVSGLWSLFDIRAR